MTKFSQKSPQIISTLADDVALLAGKCNETFEPTAEDVEKANAFAAEIYKRWMNRNTRNVERGS